MLKPVALHSTYFCPPALRSCSPANRRESIIFFASRRLGVGLVVAQSKAESIQCSADLHDIEPFSGGVTKGDPPQMMVMSIREYFFNPSTSKIKVACTHCEGARHALGCLISLACGLPLCCGSRKVPPVRGSCNSASRELWRKEEHASGVPSKQTPPPQKAPAERRFVVLFTSLRKPDPAPKQGTFCIGYQS